MIRETVWNGKKVHVLSNKILTLLINPEDGMNIYDVIYHDVSLIKWDEERYIKKLTYGVPILYPTPNRVEQDKIHFEGETYEAKMHGLVRNKKFCVCEEDNLLDSCKIRAYLEWNEEAVEEFSMFPFKSRLEICIALEGSLISYEYKVINKGNKKLPYGFGIHPFFQTISEHTSVILPKASEMEMDDNKLPTGRKKESIGFDITKGIQVSETKLDHVFMNCGDELKAQIAFEDFQINIKATKEFDYVVVYTPPKDFFCVENQTGATNTHNLYEKGYQEESGLIIVNPGEMKSGRIQFEFAK